MPDNFSYPGIGINNFVYFLGFKLLQVLLHPSQPEQHVLSPFIIFLINLTIKKATQAIIRPPSIQLIIFISSIIHFLGKPQKLSTLIYQERCNPSHSHLIACRKECQFPRIQLSFDSCKSCNTWHIEQCEYHK